MIETVNTETCTFTTLQGTEDLQRRYPCTVRRNMHIHLKMLFDNNGMHKCMCIANKFNSIPAYM